MLLYGCLLLLILDGHTIYPGSYSPQYKQIRKMNGKIETKKRTGIKEKIASLSVPSCYSVAYHAFPVFEGTFTLSNLGMFGVDRFDAILPPGTVSSLKQIIITFSFSCMIPAKTRQYLLETETELYK